MSNMESDDVITVGELDRRLRRAVEGASEDLWIEGEVASLKRAPSGHVYFVLKDEREEAIIDCVMYRFDAQRARRVLTEGARLQLKGRATVWAPRGRLQLVATLARLAGRGELLLALEQLKLSPEQMVGVHLIRQAIEEPLRQIVQNAGLEAAVIVERVRQAKGGEGFNALTETFEDLYKAGVIDPTKVTKTALTNAASVASLLLTTEALVAEKPREEAATGAPGMDMAGMGGMGGMGMGM